LVLTNTVVLDIPAVLWIDPVYQKIQRQDIYTVSILVAHRETPPVARHQAMAGVTERFIALFPLMED
jgi:hypothetical protein